MTALPFVANVLKVQLNGIAGISKMANIFHVKWTGTAPSVATLQLLATDIAAAYLTNFGANLSANFAWKNYIITDLTSATSNRAEGTLSGSGSAAGAMLPGNVALVISWSIALRYRGGHPRTYLGGIPSAQATDSNTWGSAALTAFGTGATNFLTAVNALTRGGNTYALGSVDYWAHGAKPPQLLATPLFYPFQSATVHPRIDTQRRRLGKEPI